MKSWIKKIIVYIITLEAKIVLKVHKPFIIGITGNIGKTTTKDTVAAALEGYSINGRGVRATNKSLNSELGVPLTILNQSSGWNSISKWLGVMFTGLGEIFNKNYPSILILEIGADHKGDIKSIMKWVHLDIGVMTQFAEVPVHIENFKDKNEMIKEKSYLAFGIKSGGTFIYNSDCADSKNMAEKLNKKRNNLSSKKVNIISFGRKLADCSSGIISNDIKNRNVKAVIRYESKNYNIACGGVLGDAAILSALPAFIIAKYFEIDKSGNIALDVQASIENIKNMKRGPGRMKLLDGENDTVIIDDSYNSSPLAVVNGLNTLNTLNTLSKVNRKIVILGDMLELGDYTKDEHLKIGKQVAKVSDILITVGARAKFIAGGALEAGMKEGFILECENAEEAGKEAIKILKPGDIIYIKGSQGMRMERATKILLDRKVILKDNIPRQEKEWLDKK